MSEGKATSHAKMSQCLAPRESPTNISPLLLLLMPPSGGRRERRVWWTRAETSCITTQARSPCLTRTDREWREHGGKYLQEFKMAAPEKRGTEGRGAEQGVSKTSLLMLLDF